MPACLLVVSNFLASTRPQEWDGLVRVAFMRKNKTLRALFTNKHVLDMLDKNYKTWCSLQGKVWRGVFLIVVFTRCTVYAI